MIYLIVFFLLLLPIVRYRYNQGSQSSNGYYYFEYVVLVLLMGLRFRVGGDSIRYEYFYESQEDLKTCLEEFSLLSKNSFQPFWVLLMGAFKSITNDFILFQIVHAVFMNGCVFYFGNKLCNNRFSFILLYFCISYTYFGTEILREGIAAMCFMMSLKYLENNQFIKYYLLCFIAIMFHISAIYLIFMPLLYFIISKITVLKSICFIVIIFFVISHYISGFITAFSDMFFLENNELLIKSENILTADKYNFIGITYQMVIKLTPILIAYFYVIKQNNELKLKKFVVLMYMLVNVIGIFYSPLNRLENYFVIPFLVVLSDMTFGGNKYISKLLVRLGIVIVLLSSFNYYNSNIEFQFASKEIKHYKLYYPYYSIFDKEYDPDREYVAINQF